MTDDTGVETPDAPADPVVRKRLLVSETVHRDGERALDDPITRVAAVVVFENPFAGEWREDLSTLSAWGATFGRDLGRAAAAELGGPGRVETYGKGAIVGGAGEREHAAALLHPELGAPLREAVGGGAAIIPSAKKLGGPGTTLDVPLHYKDEAYVRSHYDAMEVRATDAPRPDEILLAVALADGGRPHPRIGGLTKAEAEVDSDE